MRPSTSSAEAEGPGELAAILAELEAVRLETAASIKQRSIIRVPLGVLAGLAFAWGNLTSANGNLMNVILPIITGAAVGYLWASSGPSNAYRALYKEQVLSKLASRFGDLRYRQAITPDLKSLSRNMVLPDFDSSSSEDEISGRYRGLAVAIFEVEMTKGSGKHRRTVFDGLLAQLELPRRLSGSTTIVADGGGLLNFARGLGQSGRERVRIEDPAFEKRYEVFSTDQIAARALLTPAFISRFMALDDLPGFARLAAHAEDNTLMMAMPKSGGRNLFEPPSWRNPAASTQAIATLDEDISAVLKIVDAMIDLDEFSRSAAEAGPPTLGAMDRPLA